MATFVIGRPPVATLDLAWFRPLPDELPGLSRRVRQGAPPEINSVINPVRATSVALVMDRMKQSGMDISRAEAVKLAQQSNVALLLRLHKGGQDMPPFPHLNEAEVRSLFAYLKLLAGVPRAAREQLAVTESPLHIGEHIVKSTCHTCHSATGPDPNPQQLWDGAIPPLSTLTTRKSGLGLSRRSLMEPPRAPSRCCTAAECRSFTT